MEQKHKHAGQIVQLGPVIDAREVGVHTKPNSCITWMCLLIIIKIAFSAFAIFTTLDAFLQLLFTFFTFDKMFKIDFEAKYRLLWCFGPFRAFSLAQSCTSLYKIVQVQKSFVQVYWCGWTLIATSKTCDEAWMCDLLEPYRCKIPDSMVIWWLRPGPPSWRKLDDPTVVALIDTNSKGSGWFLKLPGTYVIGFNLLWRTFMWRLQRESHEHGQIELK